MSKKMLVAEWDRIIYELKELVGRCERAKNRALVDERRTQETLRQLRKKYAHPGAQNLLAKKRRT